MISSNLDWVIETDCSQSRVQDEKTELGGTVIQQKLSRGSIPKTQRMTNGKKKTKQIENDCPVFVGLKFL
jgi:hypothetical protein